MLHSTLQSELMDHREALLAAEAIDGIARTNRRRAAALPFPIAAIAAVDFVMCVAAFAVGPEHLAPFGAAAFAIALVFVARHLRRRRDRDGVEVSVRVWICTAIGLFFAAAITSRIGVVNDIDAVVDIGPPLSQAVGIWLLSRWADSRLLEYVALAMVLASTILSVLLTGDAALAAQIAAYGTILAVTAFLLGRDTTT